MDEVPKKSTKAGRVWTDSELAIVIDAYLYLLQLELSGVSWSQKDLADFLQEGALLQRNEASIRYRMRNISHVLATKNLPRLKPYSGASQVGSGVEVRISSLLDERSDVLVLIQKISETKASQTDDRIQTIEKLDQLYEKLSEYDNDCLVGIGHNNPPSSLELEESDIASAKRQIIEIKDQIQSAKPDHFQIEKSKSFLIKFGLKLAIWIGQRVTDFSKAAAIAAGTGFGVWSVGLTPKVVEVLQSVTSYIQNLPY